MTTETKIPSMNLHVLNVALFNKLALAVAIIRNTPAGIKPDAFVRSLAKRLFPRPTRSDQLEFLLDEELILRQQAQLLPPVSSLSSSISLMDFTTDDKDQVHTNEYEYGEFAEKVLALKDKQNPIKVDDVEFLLKILTKWLTSTEIDNRKLPADACLYTVQLIANNLKTDNDKPYHIVLDLLPIVDKFLECLLDTIEHAPESNVFYLHQMIISLSSAHSCVSRVIEKICTRLRLHCDSYDNMDDYNRQFSIAISLPDPIERLFNLLHEIVHNRSVFQRRLTPISLDKLFAFLNHASIVLDGKRHLIHVLKLEGQLQAAHYKRSGTSVKSFRSYASSSSSEHSQCQQSKHYTPKAPLPPSKIGNNEYSLSQHSQSQYF